MTDKDFDENELTEHEKAALADAIKERAILLDEYEEMSALYQRLNKKYPLPKKKKID